MGPIYYLGILLWLWLVAAGPLWAQTPDTQRLIALFDFEEQLLGEKLGNYEKLPLHWYVIGRRTAVQDANFANVPVHSALIEAPGYPSWTKIGYDSQHRISGDYSLYLGLNGGSAGAFLRVGALAAVPRSDYVITAAVRTTLLEHATARLVACFVDRDGNRLDGSISSSPPIATKGRWQQISVPLTGDHPQAAWILLQIELNQPNMDPRSALGDREIVYEQVRGGAWFDDIGVWQLPRLTIRTQNTVNIIRAPQRPELTVAVRELSGRPMTAVVTVYDHRSVPVASMMMDIGGVVQPRQKWTPNLPGFGWYLVDLRVEEDHMQGESSTAQSLVARALSTFLWLGDDRVKNLAELKRFAIVAEQIPRDQLRLMPDLMDQARLTSVVISAWEQGTTLLDLPQRQTMLEEVLTRLSKSQGDVTLSLNPIPSELAQRLEIGGDDALGMSLGTDSGWLPYLRPVVMQHGQQVRHWQLGSLERPSAFAKLDLDFLTQQVSGELRKLALGSQLLLAWQLTQARRPEVDEGIQYRISVPSAVQPELIPSFMRDWYAPSSTDSVEVHLHIPPATDLTHTRRCEDLALRMVYAWEVEPAGVSLTTPWAASAEIDHTIHPDPLLGVFSTVAHRLIGTRPRGRMALGHGLVSLIFVSNDVPGEGLLVAWNRSAAREDALINMYLGEAPVALDIFGNRQALVPVASRHQVALSHTPVFIEGIDADLAIFRAAFGVDPAFIESSQVAQVLNVTLYNPWRRTISGQLRFTGPVGWSIEQRARSFSIPSGQVMTVPIQIVLPITEPAGPKYLTAQVTFMADKPYAVDLRTPIDLGLRDVGLEATVTLEVNPKTGRRETVVTQLISNHSNKTMALYAFAHPPGKSRQERPIPELKAGQVIMRRFYFPGALSGGLTQRVRVGLRQAVGPTMLNKIVTPVDASEE